MFTMRTVIIIGICCLLGCVGWFFYLKQDTQKFKESLPQTPTMPVIKQEEKSTRPPMSTKTPPSTASNITDVDREQVEVDKTVHAPIPEPEPAPKHVPETYQMSQEEIQQITEKAFSLQFTDLDEMYSQLGEALTTRFGDDERVPRFLSLWKKAVIIQRELKDLKNKTDLQTFLDLSPSTTVTELAEVAIDLFNQDEAEAARTRESVDNLTLQFNQIAIIQSIKPILEESMKNGEMTREEAAEFLREAVGAEVVIKE